MVNASSMLVGSFVALALLVAGAFVVGAYRSALGAGAGASRARRSAAAAGLATVAWLAITAALAATGRLSFTSRPPTMALLMAVACGGAVAVGVSRFGLQLATGLPLAALVGAQAFRFPLELL